MEVALSRHVINYGKTACQVTKNWLVQVWWEAVGVVIILATVRSIGRQWWFTERCCQVQSPHKLFEGESQIDHRGDALTIIITSENYKLAKKFLKERYGKEQRLKAAHINNLLNLTICANTHTELCGETFKAASVAWNALPKKQKAQFNKQIQWVR